MVRAPACHAGGRRFEPDPGRSSKVLQFIGRSCKQDCRDERQTFSSSPQNFASQIFVGAPLEIRVGGCRDNCTAYASVAQSVEQGTENPRVIGSIPIGGTICGRSSSGRAPPCQGGGSEFEPRRPLHLWKFSSAGRASALQAEGQRFEPVNFHHVAR